MPAEMAPRVGDVSHRQDALLARIRASRLAPDLAAAIRQNEEASRFTNEADCAFTSQEFAETPRGKREYERGLRSEEERLRTAELRFERLKAACAAR